MNKRIYLSPPFVDDVEKKLLLDAFDSNWIAPIGPCIDKLEKNIANYLNVKNACAMSSGTAALDIALKLIGIKENDKILCPSLTFVATANAILYQKAEPIFIDSSPKTWVIDLDTLEKAIKKHKPKALISVDLYGQSCDYNSIYNLCNKYDVLIIEDAAEALGSTYRGKKCGSFGEVGILSFNGNKIITSSGGGVLASDNEDYVKRAKYLSTQSREPVLHYEHKEIGYNYRMSNILAALGLGQLKKIEDFIDYRRKNYNKYYKELSQIDGFVFMQEADNVISNRWLTTLTIDKKKLGFSNIDLINKLEEENIESRPVWKPMHLQPLFKNFKYIRYGKRDVSDELYQHGICLPSGSNLTNEDQDRIINIILSMSH